MLFVKLHTPKKITMLIDLSLQGNEVRKMIGMANSLSSTSKGNNNHSIPPFFSLLEKQYLGEHQAPTVGYEVYLLIFLPTHLHLTSQWPSSVLLINGSRYKFFRTQYRHRPSRFVYRAQISGGIHQLRVLLVGGWGGAGYGNRERPFGFSVFASLLQQQSNWKANCRSRSYICCPASVPSLPHPPPAGGPHTVCAQESQRPTGFSGEELSTFSQEIRFTHTHIHTLYIHIMSVYKHIFSVVLSFDCFRAHTEAIDILIKS